MSDPRKACNSYSRRYLCNSTSTSTITLRVKDGTIRSDPSSLHPIHHLLCQLGIRNDENRSRLTLDNKPVSNTDHVWPPLRASIPNDGLTVGLSHRLHDLIPVCRFRIRCRPQDAPWGHVCVEKG